MVRAVAAQRFGMQDRLILTGVQMPPPAFRLVVVERARLAALRTRPLCSSSMDQMYVNFSSSTSAPRDRRSTGIASPGSGHIVPCPAPAHYALTHSKPGL